MKVIDLKGKQHVWNLDLYRGKREKCSEPHAKCRELLKEMYPFDVVLEELTLPGTQLYLDFYIHSKRLAIEVNGKQHYEYTPFFHDSKKDFLKAGQRDRVKAEWLELNGITLINLPYSESVDEWRTRIQGNG